MHEPARIAILCFHRVLPASRREGSDEPYFVRQTALALDRFRDLLDELVRRDAILPPETLLAWLNQGAAPPRPGVILTFDDGYADVLELAAPELQARGVRALLCVTTAVASGVVRGFPVDHWYAAIGAATVRRGMLEGFTRDPWSFDLDLDEDRARLVEGPEKRAFVGAQTNEQKDMLVRLHRALGVEVLPAIPRVLDVDDLRSLAREGFLLGSHGERHVHLPRLPECEAAEQMRRSRAFFADHGLPDACILAYPDGATCPRTEALAKAAGFSIGLALGSRFATRDDDPLALPRLIPTNDPGWFRRRLLPLFQGEGG
ncbi:polysaccharide deacetylase family protein [Polyangium sp. 6x1]|uniref:polysaccharide deacetylase family protein n=1 Tax=Polyangium sp. 6x1 TaxID=3042689 RepID=UPI0024826D54|nr:polysaccharide deacetylase family protein [Polyangium sp. 6x1]MDI1443604.1 polysaccharide deacetylase family protein [Polyangium sp. 6x1]